MGELEMLKRKTVKVGDIFQILTAKGVCYGQVTHTHPKWKFVVAIFRDFFTKEPVDFNEVVIQQPQLITTFLIQDGVKRVFFPWLQTSMLRPTYASFLPFDPQTT